MSHFRRAYLIGSINGALWRCPLAEILHICCILVISGMGAGLDIHEELNSMYILKKQTKEPVNVSIDKLSGD